MEKIIQEFRIIETDDGFRIEIKGDKEQLREFVMNMDPRQWARRRGPGRGIPFEMHRSRGRRREHGFRFGPMGAWFGFDWEGCDEDEPQHEHKSKRHHGVEGDVV
jgi:hypothetical protein